MKSVADDLRAELREETNRLSLDERIALALRLGEEGIERFRLANGLDRETDDGKRWTGTIPKTGDYYLYVVAHPTARYTLRVSTR